MNTTLSRRVTLTSTALAAALGALSPAQARERDALVDLVNAYRSAPRSCGGRIDRALPPLLVLPALARVTIPSGAMLDQVLARAGYPVAQAEVITISGAPDATSVLAAIERKHCKSLRSTRYAAAGSTRSGETWTLVLAQPAPPKLVRVRPEVEQSGLVVLAAVNAARAAPRNCGGALFEAVPPLAWNAQLAEVALAHSGDMAAKRYFSHQGKDGRSVADRATQAGYRFRTIGENIAAGQDSAAEAIAGWLDSPGHCANIMNRQFTEMGVAFAASRNADGEMGKLYWTQVLGAPR